MTWRTLTRAALALVVATGASSGILAGSAMASPGDLNIGMVKDVYPGAGGGAFDLTGVNGTLFFVGSTPGSGDELWKSDGTGAGTTMVKEINTTPTVDENCDCHELTNVGGTLLFAATDGVNGMELWRSDGTSAGTAMVADINTTSANADSSPDHLTNVNGTLFFTADDGTGGVELYKSAAPFTSATLVQDINTAAGTGSDPTWLTNVGGTLFFAADDGTHGTELWKSVGPTYSSATMVADINPTASQGSNPYSLADLDGTLFLAADDGTHGTELWKSNGAALGPGGTEMVKDINTTSTGVGSELGALTSAGGTLYFRANDDSSTHGAELWKSDGTTDGTSLVADIWPGSIGSQPANFANIDGTLLFSAGSTSATPAPGNEPWRSDGGPLGSGTDPVGDLNPGNLNSNPGDFTSFAGGAFFRALDATHGEELWRATPPFTSATVFADINQTSQGAGSSPREFTDVNGTLFFHADDGLHGRELWRIAVEGAPPPSGGGSTPVAPGPTSTRPRKKCKKKKHRAAVAKKKCKKKRR